MFGAPRKIVHICPAGHKSTPQDYYTCQKCCKECFTQCICHIRWCKVCGKDRAYNFCKCERNMKDVIEKKIKDSENRFNELTKRRQEIEAQQQQLNVAHSEILNEQLRLQGEHRAFRGLIESEGKTEEGSDNGEREDGKIISAANRFTKQDK